MIGVSGVDCDNVLQDWEKPETIPDPDATKPSDWDEDMDGEWEPAMIANPEYQVQPGALITQHERLNNK